jgi:2,3-bisphosphoglycerate-independent phosphoglycerate mutase
MRAIVVVLDGVADRPSPRLGDRTPLEAADTPNLDRLASMGWTGVLRSAGPRGSASGCDFAHLSLLGYPAESYPGRAVFEAAGEGLTLSPEEVVCRAALASAELTGDGELRVTRRGTGLPDERCAELAAALGPFTHEGVHIEYVPTAGGKGIVYLRGDVSEDVTDTDPYVDGGFVVACEPLTRARDSHSATRTASAVRAWTRQAHRVLSEHPVNAQWTAEGHEAANVAVLRWAGRTCELPDFHALSGFRGASVSSGVMFKGLASQLGMELYEATYLDDWGDDLLHRLELAELAIGDGHDYVHVHTKAPDEASRGENPDAKRLAIEGCDRALGRLFGGGPLLGDDTVLVVTGDHGTPSAGPLIHSADAVPILIVGRYTWADPVTAFSERACVHGSLGRMSASELLPTILNLTDRIKYGPARLTPGDELWWPDEPKRFRLE